MDRALVEPAGYARQRLEQAVNIYDLRVGVSMGEENVEKLTHLHLLFGDMVFRAGARRTAYDSNGSDVYCTLSAERSPLDSRKQTSVPLESDALCLLFVVLEARVVCLGRIKTAYGW